MEKAENSNNFIWGSNRRFNAHSNQIFKKFGGRVQKVSINAGFTCPNRDGSKGKGGCTYCNNSAFSPSYCSPEISIEEQIQTGIKFHSSRYRRSVGYFAYFQTYSNTYAPIKELKAMYEKALSVEGVLGLVIGTRPDCVDNEMFDYFESLNKRTYLSIEYGIESCFDKTLIWINRGHDFSQTVYAIEETAKRGINVGGHLIFGLPGESREEMMSEVDYLNRLPLNSIKFHQLQIVKGTKMEQEYHANPEYFELFGWEEYRDFLITFIEHLKPTIEIDRLTGEAPPSLLSGPRWNMKRTDSLQTLFEERMAEIDSWQGKRYNTK
jgi:hypothetical protein